MTRTLTVRHPWLGRVIALLVGVCLAFGGLEAMVVPDVHDGDVATVSPGGPGHGAAVSDAARLATGHADDHGAWLDRDGVTSSPLGDPAPAPQHSTHVDHCIHAHAVAPPAALLAARRPALASTRAPGSRDLPHASALRPPLWRPPKV